MAESDSDTKTSPCDRDDSGGTEPFKLDTLSQPPPLSGETSSEGSDREEELADCKSPKGASEKLATLLASRSVLKRKNVYLLKKLFIHCKRKKIGGVCASDEWTSGAGAGADCQEKYQETLELYYGLKRGIEEEETLVKAEMSQLHQDLDERETEANTACKELTKLQISVGKSLLHPRTARQFNSKTIEAMIKEQNSLLKELREARLRFIKLKNLVGKKQRQLADMEKVDGLNLQDFKQLQMDQQSLDAKIEDRQEELAKAELKIKESCKLERQLKARTTRARAALSKARIIFSQTQQRLDEETEILEKLAQERDQIQKSESPSRRSNLSSYPLLVEDFQESLKRMETRQTRLEGLRASQWEIGREIRHTRRRIRILSRRRQKATAGPHSAREARGLRLTPGQEKSPVTRVQDLGDDQTSAWGNRTVKIEGYHE